MDSPTSDSAQSGGFFPPASPSSAAASPSSAGAGGAASSLPLSSSSPAPNAASLDPSMDYLPEPTRYDDALTRPLSLGLGEDVLLPFVEEYAKLQQALAKSHDSETRFVNKCRALTKQTRAHTHKLTALHAMYLQDQKKKASHAAEIEARKVVLSRLHDETREKRDAAASLRSELQSLGQQLEESSNEFLRNQRNAIARLELEVNKYSMVRDKDRTSLTKARSKNVDLFKQLQDMLAALSRSQQEFDGLEAKLLEARALSGKELRRKAELERAMKEVQLRVGERQAQLVQKKELVAKAQRELLEVESQLSKSEKVVEAHRVQYDELNEAARASNEGLLEIQESNETLASGLKKVVQELEADKAATKAARAASESKLRQLELMRDRVKDLGEEVREEEEAKSQSQNQMKLLKEQISVVQFKLNANAKSMDTCVREREVLAQNHSTKVDAIRGKEAALKIKNSTLKNIKNEHQGYLISIRALTKILEDLKKDKAGHEVDLGRRMMQKARAMEEVAARELQITEYQAQILLNEGKLRQQQNLLEAVRSDRNLYRKTLIEQQTEMHEYKRKFHFLSTQVKQSKSEIEDKNQFIVFEHFNLQNVRDDIDQLEQQNSSTFTQLTQAEAVTKTQTMQVRKLATIIADADEELRVQVKQYNSIVNEQRVLNQQLVKRNDELATLYEQLKLQNSILSKSAAHYKEKQILLQEFERESVLVSTTLEEVLGDISKFVSLRDTISELQENLLGEQLKVKALSDELKKPINVHRWRRMMDTNTDTFGMITRVRHLQKEIIAKTDSVGQKDQAIQEKEKLYVDLRRVLARQPGSEAAEQLRVYLEQLDEKKGKLKSMRSELKLYQTRVKEYTFDMGKLNQDMQLIKLAYFQRRRAAQRKAAAAGGNAWRGDSAGGQGYDDLPDILRPTEFPSFTPPADLLPSSSSAAFDPNQSYAAASGLNPYLLSSAPMAADSNPFPSSSASAGSKHVRGLDESDDDDDDNDGGDDDGDEDESLGRRGGKAAEEEKLQQQPAAHGSHRPLSASSRGGAGTSRGQLNAVAPNSARPESRSALSRPDSRSTSITGAPLNLASLQQHQQSSGGFTNRSDSRNSARGSSAGGQLSQRGDAKFSRFPSIAGSQQQ